MAAGHVPVPKGFNDELRSAVKSYAAGEGLMKRPERPIRRPKYFEDYTSGSAYDSIAMEMTKGGQDDDLRSIGSRSSRKKKLALLEAAQAKVEEAKAAWEVKKRNVELAVMKAELESGSDENYDSDHISFSEIVTPEDEKKRQSPHRPFGLFEEAPAAPQMPGFKFGDANQPRFSSKPPLQYESTNFWRQQGILMDKGPHPSSSSAVILHSTKSKTKLDNEFSKLKITTETPSFPAKPAPPKPPPKPFTKTSFDSPSRKISLEEIPKFELSSLQVKKDLDELKKIRQHKASTSTMQMKTPTKTEVKSSGGKEDPPEKNKSKKGKGEAPPPPPPPKPPRDNRPPPKEPSDPSDPDDSSSSSSSDSESNSPHRGAKKKKKSKKKKKNKVDDITSAMMLFVNRQGSRPLPNFTGDPTEWPAFFAEYEDSNADCKFTEQQKMSRLRAALKGKARAHVQEYLMLPNMADKIMDSLKRLYGRPEFIIDGLIEKTRKLEAPKESRPETLISFSTSVSTMANCIESMKCQAHLSNPMLVKELMGKLPPSMKLRWGREVKEKYASMPPTIHDFALWLSDLAEDASYVYTPSETTPTKTDRKKGEKSKAKEESSMVTTDSLTPAKVTSQFKGCAFCGDASHSIGKCPKFDALGIDGRFSWTKDNARCFRCLLKGHRTAVCGSKTKCDVKGCTKPAAHHRLLHRTFTRKADSQVAEFSEDPEVPKKQNKSKAASKLKLLSSPEAEDGDHCTTVKNTQPNSKVLYKIGPVKLFGPNGFLIVHAFFDDGSSVSLLDKIVAQQLGLTGTTETLKLSWLKKEKIQRSETVRVSMEISGTWDGAKKYSMKDVRTMAHLDLPQQSLDVKELAKSYAHLNGLKCESFDNVKPVLLIGQPHWFLGFPLSFKYRTFSGPVASRTRLGWIIHGNVCQNEDEKDFSLTIRHEDEDADLKKLIQDSFSTESFGVAIPKNLPKSKQLQRAEDILKSTTKRVGQRFETGLLWKTDSFTYPEILKMAYKRLTSTEKKLKKDPALAETYSKRIEDYILKGYARKLTPEEIEMRHGRIWYLPHFPVVNPNKPEKPARLVFDARAESHGVSFNSG